MSPCSDGQRSGSVPWSSARSAPFFGSGNNRHHYGCQPSTLPATSFGASCLNLLKSAGAPARQVASPCTFRLRSTRTGPTARPASASSPWLGASLPGKLSSAAQGSSHHGASIAQTLKAIKHCRWMSHSLGGDKPTSERRSRWEKGPEGKGEISGKAQMSPATAVPSLPPHQVSSPDSGS